MLAAEMSFQHYVLGLYAVANNIPAIPLFIALCQGLSPREQHKLCSIATFTSLTTMLVALFTGAAILDFFEIGIDAFRMAGGVLLMTSGLSMVNSRPKAIEKEAPQGFSEMISLAVIPVAIPLTTGAGTISTVILFAEPLHTWAALFKLLGAVLTVVGTVYVTFFFSPAILRFLGHTGMQVVTKIFGLITLALGIQFLLTGVMNSFPGLVR